MISSIEITRFRGIREGRLDDLTPLVVLVGPNGCGKSTVLDAALIGASSLPGQAMRRVAKRHAGVVRSAEWLFYRPVEQRPSEIRIETSTHAVRHCRLARHPVMDESLTKVACYIVSGPSEDTNAQKAVAEFSDAATGRCDDVISPLDGVADVGLVEPPRNGLQEPLHELYSQVARAGRREQAKGIIAEAVSGLNDIQILTEAEKPILYFVYENSAVPAALAGDGVHALVRVALELASRSDGVVLVEEPEVHQHPAAICQSVRAILAAVRRGVQVILTTHSLELIDYILAESSSEELQSLSIYRLQLKDGVLTSHRTPGADVAFLRTQIESDLR